MAGQRVTPGQKKKYFTFRAEGSSIAVSAQRAGFSESTALRFERQTRINPEWTPNKEAAEMLRANRLRREAVAESKLPGPVPLDRLNPEAKRALEDFDYFRRRYFGRISMPWQILAANDLVQLLHTDEREFVDLNEPPGSGKALALWTPLATPTGWTTIGEVKVGDEVFDENGKPCRVVAKSEIFMGHDCYEVKTDDGASVVADAAHLWPVMLAPIARVKKRQKPHYEGKTGPKPNLSGVTVRETHDLTKTRNKRPSLAVGSALSLPQVDLPLDPYVLGVWLGDGHSAGGRISSSEDDQIWVRQFIEEAGFTTTDQRARQSFGVLKLQAILSQIGVLNNKHVPETYLRSSAEQRLSLLQGLIDTDGYVGPSGHVEFCNTNRDLAEAVRFLVHSLGAKASLRVGRATLNGKDCGPKYRVAFYLENCARLPRKAQLTRSAVRTTRRYLSVTPVESEPTQCIQVDSPSHLYLAGEGLMVTHNSTLLTDFKAWLICRDRTVRILTGSATQSLARRQLMRLRRSLERMVPLTADPKDIARGVAIDAESTLPKDFGRFKPTDKELWNQDAFIVMQHEGMGAIEDKEATCTAYGIDTEFTGGRFDYVEWDDLVSPKSVGSAQYREDLESIYVKTCEARVEPSGLMVLSGQRLAADDLHRFVLDMVRPPEDEDDELDEDEVREAIEQGDRSNMKYRHIVFKAHYEDRCKNEHTKASKPFPDGCLLDPRRLPWRDLASAQANNPSEYSLVYQQEDADPAQALVKREWVYGDENHLGCVDYDRDQWELPEGVSFHDCVVFATADPSPTMYWSVQAWCYHEPSKSMILLAHVRKKMRMPEMLDRDIHGNYTGIMEEWRKISDRIGFPIGTWIVEHNAAQRFMLQQSLLRDWRLVHGVEVRPHSTTMNKADPHYGVWTMANLWRLGRVRLPMRDGDARMSSMKLIEEVLVYDHGRTDDCVMAMWMGHWNLPDLALPEDTSTDIERPSWVLEAAF